VRKTKVFGGSSHPELTGLITGRLGVEAGAVKLSQFKNKETSVEIGNVFYSLSSLHQLALVGLA
jgi:ribose-phosphate pyrophosphokinase